MVLIVIFILVEAVLEAPVSSLSLCIELILQIIVWCSMASNSVSVNKTPMAPSEFFAKIYGEKKTKSSHSDPSSSPEEIPSTTHIQPLWTPVYPSPTSLLLSHANWRASNLCWSNDSPHQLYDHLQLPPALTALSMIHVHY